MNSHRSLTNLHNDRKVYLFPNYSERYHHDEAVSSALAESTVNEIISRRMAKKQQMRWTQKGAHLLLQARTRTLNNELKDSFRRWYPKMDENCDHSLPLAASPPTFECSP